MTDTELQITVRFDSAFPVDLRELHEGLKSKQDYSTWAKARLSQFAENEDFGVFHKVGEKPVTGRHRIDYHVTLDAAKEIAMMENTQRGREVRRYFIAVEKAFRQQPPARLSVPDLIAGKIAAHTVTGPESVEVLRLLVDLHRDITMPTNTEPVTLAMVTPSPSPMADWLATVAARQVEAGIDERLYTVPELLAQCPPIPNDLPNRAVSLGQRLGVMAGQPVPMSAGLRAVIVPMRSRRSRGWLLQVTQAM
jgi:phage anti-repressor protein